MEEDVVWRRDIYRELKLTEDANAGLYYPTEPVGSQMNLPHLQVDDEWSQPLVVLQPITIVWTAMRYLRFC